MTLFIDADALPNILKPILMRSIDRLSIKTIVVSNKKVILANNNNNINYLIVNAGVDEADNKIVEMLQEGDLVVTADIPLADRVITKNASAIDHRGELYDKNNIKQYLAMRNLMENIRETGEITKGPKPFSQKNAHKFANQLNNFLYKHLEQPSQD